MRISTTTLESFRLFMQPDQDWMTEADLIASIKGEFVPTPAVLLGSAFGKVLETPDHYRTAHGYRCGDYTFANDVMAPALKLMDYERGMFEVKAARAYGDCDVVAVADQIVGGHLFEHKTTGSTFNFEKYADSCQWRFYVDIFQPLLVTYHVFELDDHGNGVAEIKASTRSTCSRIPGCIRTAAICSASSATTCARRGWTGSSASGSDRRRRWRRNTRSRRASKRAG
jgi:hypothetical protein